MEVPRSPCPLCDQGALAVGRRDGLDIWDCHPCRFRFVAPESSQPGPFEREYFESASGEYGDYAADELGHRRASRRLLARLRRGGIDGGHLLDVGCAAGFFLDEARRAGWEIHGVEISSWASTYARERLGVPVVNADFVTAPLPEAGYDAVTLLGVLSTLEDPRAVELKLRHIVRPGGHVAIETWDWTSPVARAMGMSWHQYNPRYIRSHLSRHTLPRLFTQPSWRIRSVRTATKCFSAARLLDVLSCRYGVHLPQPWFDAARRVPVPYHLGDLLWIVVQRER